MVFGILIFLFILSCRSASNRTTVSAESETDLSRREADQLWEQRCSSCHGLDGTPNEFLQPKPKKLNGFGIKMGFFFGGDKMREGIFRTIRNGKNERMPSFQKELSEEQIRALVRKIERL
ncbi:cytochrome c [Leptospira gomenensis]|uniref:Cytochrome c n=1 Tax=Leptospira gomenensis TaxID=2484974 RepID=A0A5F1YA11_9LEPT|nr:cytochrome c [Leptospira gomenensis]TGK37213.1 cytochrome c [Leptospira gomenensis]TGK44406.1 cytochrome c [Leptospira gomenensis]TGK58900.1 cytochrome c [Leptospira gomenensis]